MKKAVYVSLEKPLRIKEFEFQKSPMGWIRIDILQRKMGKDAIFRQMFSVEEQQVIFSYKEDKEK